MARPEPAAPSVTRAAFLRGAGLFGFWLLLAGPGGEAALGDPGFVPTLAADLAVGLLAAAAATWVSVGLLPPAPGHLSFGSLTRFALHFIWQSVAAGIDVARRVFDPRLPLKPGYLAYPVRLPPGSKRCVFGAVTSLMPGTLMVGTDADDALVYHCLDMDQPVAANLALDEALLTCVRHDGADSD